MTYTKRNSRPNSYIIALLIFLRKHLRNLWTSEQISIEILMRKLFFDENFTFITCIKYKKLNL